MDKRLATLTKELIEQIDYLCDGMAGGMLNANQFQAEMARTLLEHHIASYYVGAKSRELNAAAWETIRAHVEPQIDRLNNFADVIDDEGWRDAHRSRAHLYAGSLKATYSAGRNVGWALPVHPGDGGTECNNGCLCSWRVDVIDAEELDADAYWIRHADDSCRGCLERQAAYSPYRIRGGLPA